MFIVARACVCVCNVGSSLLYQVPVHERDVDVLAFVSFWNVKAFAYTVHGLKRSKMSWHFSMLLHAPQT